MQDFQDSQLLIDTEQWKQIGAPTTDQNQHNIDVRQISRPGILRRVLRVLGIALTTWSDSLHDLQMNSPAAVSARSHHIKPRSR